MVDNANVNGTLSGWIDPTGAWHNLTKRGHGNAGLHEDFAKSLGRTVSQLMSEGWVRVDAGDNSVIYAFSRLDEPTGKRVAADANQRDPRSIFWIDVLSPRRHTRFDGLSGLIAGLA